MLNATFSTPDLDRFCQLDKLGLTVTGQHVADDHTVLQCRVVEPDDPVVRDCWCHRCGAQGVPRGTVVRELAHVPNGWRPTILQVRVRRYGCNGCRHVWRQNLTTAAAPRSKLTTHAVLWALRAVVVDRASIARVAANLGCLWHTVNDAVLAAGRALLIDDPTRLDGVKVLGVDEHYWRHPRAGSGNQQRFVTVVIDLTPARDGTGPARLLDVVEGRSKQVFTAWLAAQTEAFRSGIETVAMDGFTGFKTAAAEAVPKATAVMDPFHVVALAGDAVDRCRQRVQQQLHGHRGRSGDPLYGIRRVLRTGASLLTDRQHARLVAVFADERHAEVQATWGIYQRVVAAYRHPDRKIGKAELSNIIDVIGKNVPGPLTELITLGRTMRRRAADVLAYFDRPGTSNGPTEAINGRLEHLRGTALAFATSATTSPEQCSTPEGSDPDYTLFCDEPICVWLSNRSANAHSLQLRRSIPALHAPASLMAVYVYLHAVQHFGSQQSHVMNCVVDAAVLGATTASFCHVALVQPF